MAQPGKRRRNAVEDEEESARHRISPSPAADPRKRPRVSIDGRATPGVDDEESDLDESDEEAEGPSARLPPPTQHDIRRDAGFEHLKYTELDDIRATQKIRQKASRLGNNMVAESGIIESVECINFMCHSRLVVELGPLINFVVGENGSGKSAVLTALTLCLGGKASDTNRGGSLKSFIKEGESQGSIMVKIKNAGTDAYRPEMYGDSIIVERTLGKGSKFKVKTATGRVMSDKKAEVDEICEWFALQINNPLTVLSQDNARQFLNSATSKQKYKFFVSGVQLEQLDNDYRLCSDQLDAILPLLDDLKEQVGYAKKATEDAEKRAMVAKQNQTLRDKRKVLRNQLIWSQVTTEERSLARIDEEISKAEQNIRDAEKHCADQNRAYDKLHESWESAKRARLELDGEAQVDRGLLDERQKEYDTAKRKVTDLQRQERDAHELVKNAEGEVGITQGKIAEEESRLAAATGTEQAETESQLSEAQSKANRLRQRGEEQKAELPELQRQLMESQQSLKKKQEAKETKRQEVRQSQQQLQHVRNQAPSELSGFEPEIVNLVRQLRDDNGFEHRPVGPIGAHIRLLKPEWSSIVEKTLGEALNAFVVRSKRDQNRLNQLVRQHRIKKPPPVFLAYCDSIDTKSQEPGSDIDTILRILEFDSELVKAQLVINNSIEKIALVASRVEAQDMMLNGPPNNVIACLTFHDGKRGFGLRLTNRQGSSSTSPIHPWTGASRLKTDSGQQIIHLQENLRILEAELSTATTEERQATAARQRCETAVKTHHASVRDVGAQLRRAEAEVETVQIEYDKYDGVDDRLKLLRAQLEEQQNKMESLGQQYGNLNALIKEAQEESRARRAGRDKVQEEQDDFMSKLAKADQKVASKGTVRGVWLEKKNDAIEKLDIAKVAKDRVAEKRGAQEERVREFTEKAAEMTERVHIPEGETYESIRLKYDRLDTQLKARYAQQGKSDAELYSEAETLRSLYSQKVRDQKDHNKLVALLKHAMDKRYERWRIFQRQISARVRMQFNMLLSERGFRGKININHIKHTIEIHIEPDETRKSAHGRNTKTLSGGEKSFSSICMLLSIWEAIGSPIRCLDEFDVFMDNVNRAISTNMLVDAARRSVGKQFILITPNAIEGRVKLEKDVKIIRLTDPRQRTLTQAV